MKSAELTRQNRFTAHVLGDNQICEISSFDYRSTRTDVQIAIIFHLVHINFDALTSNINSSSEVEKMVVWRLAW